MRVSRKLAAEAARQMNARRKTRAGGRPPKLSPCPHCGRAFGVAAMRIHLPVHNRESQP